MTVFKQLLNHSNMNVTITSAIELSAAQRKTLVTALEKKYGNSLTIEEIVNENLIGGVRVTVGSRQLDASVRGKLHKLESQVTQKL